jgi:hypothetical protein
VPRGAGPATRRFHTVCKASTELIYMNGPLCARCSCVLMSRVGCSSTFGLCCSQLRCGPL